jgi:hypothetical protein
MQISPPRSPRSRLYVRSPGVWREAARKRPPEHGTSLGSPPYPPSTAPTVTKMAARHKAAIETSDGPRTCYEARKHRESKKDLLARFGGITLRQDRRAVIRDPAPGPAPYPRKELISRLRRRECELCDRHHGDSPPGHRPQDARGTGTGTAHVGRPHGKNAAQDAHRLRRLPRLDPREPMSVDAVILTPGRADQRGRRPWMHCAAAPPAWPGGEQAPGQARRARVAPGMEGEPAAYGAGCMPRRRRMPACPGQSPTASISRPGACTSWSRARTCSPAIGLSTCCLANPDRPRPATG